jgi:hypothetical protein
MPRRVCKARHRASLVQSKLCQRHLFVTSLLVRLSIPLFMGYARMTYDCMTANGEEDGPTIECHYCH